jgi:hypothetical protein
MVPSLLTFTPFSAVELFTTPIASAVAIGIVTTPSLTSSGVLPRVTPLIFSASAAGSPVIFS